MIYSIEVSIPGIRLPLLQVDPGPFESLVSINSTCYQRITHGNGEVVRESGRSDSQIHVASLSPILSKRRSAIEDLGASRISSNLSWCSETNSEWWLERRTESGSTH